MKPVLPENVLEMVKLAGCTIEVGISNPRDTKARPSYHALLRSRSVVLFVNPEICRTYYQWVKCVQDLLSHQQPPDGTHTTIHLSPSVARYASA